MYDVMTTGQLAEYLQLNEQTVYRKAQKGEIPTIRIGKVLRFKKDVIDMWLRVLSLKPSIKKRNQLRVWSQAFAKSKGIKEQDIAKIIRVRRKNI